MSAFFVTNRYDNFKGWEGVKLRPVRNAKKISTTNISVHLIIDFDCIKLFLPFAISPSMISF